MDETTEWTTEELRETFDVLGFAAGYCVVRRKSDRVVGSLTFRATYDGDGHLGPRIYTGWTEDK